MPKVRVFLTRGGRIDAKAARMWMVLVAYAMLRPGKPITYGRLAKRMGYNKPGAAMTLAHALGMIGHLCVASGIPALNAIVVNKATGVPGAGVVLSNYGRPIAEEQQKVWGFDWFSVRVPTVGAFREVWAELGQQGEDEGEDDDEA
jgi:hypothetical protein